MHTMAFAGAKRAKALGGVLSLFVWLAAIASYGMNWTGISECATMPSAGMRRRAQRERERGREGGSLFSALVFRDTKIFI